MKKTIVWLRRDLRIHDNPALWEASEQGIVIPVFIWSKEDEQMSLSSYASKWWLHHSLLSLQKKLYRMGLSLTIRQGDSLDELTTIIEETRANAVFFNESYDSSILTRDEMIRERLNSDGVEVETFNSHLLFPPGILLNKKNEPYKVFTSFWKNTMHESVIQPKPTPVEFSTLNQFLPTLAIEDLKLLPSVNWDEKLVEHWVPGEDGAIKRWQQFSEEGMSKYLEGRDIPSFDDVSLLSPHLACGDISVRSIWFSSKMLLESDSVSYMHSSVEAFMRQLIWREFAYHQWIHFPEIVHTPLREKFEDFPWRDTDEMFTFWKKGLTGYPLVDAGMRQLWETGAIHNRVRMVVASFLVKHLLISWQEGSDWFKETLVDFDVANNAMGWQWVAGSGIDSAPYFRIFNPILQSQKFDGEGVYLRKWLPELAKLPTKYIHTPWEAPIDVLQKAEIELGKTYPFPIIDHSFARKRALEAFATVKTNI
ncbi:cryptochrome/photolyase family protein [Sporosarcina siberiensis]|uniref:Cryptochrome/photolyase family protein n=1 Tax=Sporosarcina siberiensis TaxID=1365606 RepID=A0ABW4SDA9_9BACL